MRWPVAPLGEHVDILSGFAFKSERFNNEGQGLPLVRIRDVKGGTTATYYDGDYDPKFLVRDGDLLVGMDGEFNCRPWAGGASLLNQRVCRVSVSNGCVDQSYLNRFLPLALKKIEARTSFVTVRHLSSKDIREIEIPVAPLSEQKRIAAILDQADEFRCQQGAATRRLRSLALSLFAEIFADPLRNSGSYAPLGDLCDVRDGTHDSPKYVEDGFPLLTSKNFSQGSLDLTGSRKISQADFDSINRRSKVDRGDIVMPMIGTIGSPVIIDEEPSFAIKNVALVKTARSALTPEFVKEILDSPLFQRHVADRGRGGTQKFISLGDIRGFLVPQPTNEAMQKHRAALRKIGATRKAYERKNAALQALFASLQHRAFRGGAMKHGR